MADTKSEVPANSSVIIPRLFCTDPAKQIEFCVAALGAAELGRRDGPDGSVIHALLTIRDEMIMIEGEWPTLPSRAPAADGSSPVVIYLYVADVDAVVARAMELGAQLLVPARDQFWGDRTAWIMDPSGHVLTLAMRLRETTAADRDAKWSEIVAEQETGPGRDEART